jgi:hypothetical protein
MNRRSALKLFPAVAGGAFLSSPSGFSAVPLLYILPHDAKSFHPLDEVTLVCLGHGNITVRDGAGNAYVRTAASNRFRFKAGGALGIHTASLLDDNGATVSSASFEVDCATEIRDEHGEFQKFLANIVWTMMDWNNEAPVNVIRYKDRVYQFFANWVFDHTLTLKGMKYFWPAIKDAVDFFAATQREDGMIWENCYPATPQLDYFDWKFAYGDFVRRIENNFRQLRRAPVESHVEQFFLEALYVTWKATGDTEWMKSKLDCSIKAVRYATSDPYRWSKRYQLMHRGFTIDTWDYTSDDQQKIGDDCVFVVYLDQSEFGVFYGDNTNLIIGLRRLAEMLQSAGRDAEAPEFLVLADTLQSRLDKLAWNGKFYTHWIAENPTYHPDLGVDTSAQVSFSNAYTLHRGISHEQCVAIIETYQRIRKEMPATSPGEFYGIYPPFQTGFTQNNPGKVWEYMNGGVVATVAAELALGAFEHGYEEYAVDILRRQKKIAERYRDYLPITLRGKAAEIPPRTFQKLKLQEIANADFGAGTPGIPGWMGELNKSLSGLPLGSQEFQAVPFDVIDPATNGHRSCLGISCNSGYVSTLSLPVYAKAASLYLLHASIGSQHTVGVLTFHYSDSTSYSEYLENGKNIGSWWEPHDSKYSREGPRTEDRLRLAWQAPVGGAPNKGLYAAGFNNPRPDREIASIEFAAGVGDCKWMILAATLSDAPVFFIPYDDLSSGIPDGWNAVFASTMLEGLAGVRDDGVAFSQTRLAPRWDAAGILSAEVSVRYPASTGYCFYHYHRDPASHRITLEFTGSAARFDVQVLLPKTATFKDARLDGKPVQATTITIEHSNYAVLQVNQPGVYHLELDHTPPL